MSAISNLDGKVEDLSQRRKPDQAPVARDFVEDKQDQVETAPEKNDVPQLDVKKKNGLRYVIMAIVPIALILLGSYFWVTGGRYQETENANLRQPRVTMAADQAGRVVTVNVSENKVVKKGDLLFAVDPEPFRIALEEADAGLASARLNIGQLRATYQQALAQKSNADGQVAFLDTELARQTDLSKKGVATQSALDAARRNLEQAKDQSLAANASLAGARAALGGNPDIETNQHPAVMTAQATRDKAALDLAQTQVVAPADGIISQASSFKAGQFVSVGAPLFSLVETDDVWVEANFKETQLTHMKLGQEAEVVLDTYPGHVFKAKIDTIGAGTGAEFSLLPAQNATGNWVKVTQRIPVRLDLENDDPSLILRTGMSAVVTVDTGKTRGIAGLLNLFGL